MSTVYGVIGLRHKNGIECTDYDYVARVLSVHRDNVDEIISGGARGIETLVEQWCEREGVAFRKIKPSLVMFKETVPEKAQAIEAAFMVRNQEIVANCNELIAFWNGAEHMVLAAISIAIKSDKRVHLYPLS